MTDPVSTALALAQTRSALAATPARGDQKGPINTSASAKVEHAIANAARSTTVDFDFLIAQAQVESAMNPQARATQSSATGLYQFIESTWLDTMKRHGARFGLSSVAAQIQVGQGGSAFVTDPNQRAAILDLRQDPQIAAFMAAGLAEDNRAHLTPILGRQPDSNELYLSHFLGAGGAGRFLSELKNDPSQSAADLFRKPAAANRTVFYEANGAPRSLAGVMHHLSDKMRTALSDAPSRASTFAAPSHGTSVPYQSASTPAGMAPDLGGATYAPTAMSLASLSPSQGAPSRSMSSILRDATKSHGAHNLASSGSLQRLESASRRLRAMGF